MGTNAICPAVSPQQQRWGCLQTSGLADAGTALLGGCRDTALQNWLQTSGKHPGRPHGRAELSTPPRLCSLPTPSERLRDESCARTRSPNTDFPSLLRNMHYFCCIHLLTDLFIFFLGPRSPQLLNRLRQLQRLRVKMSITLTRLLGKTKSAREAAQLGPRQQHRQ